jgi:hypothetical protein
VDDDLRIRVDALRSVIEEDKRAGRRPLALDANAGTVTIGAVDPLPALAEVAAIHLEEAGPPAQAPAPARRPPRLAGRDPLHPQIHPGSQAVQAAKHLIACNYGFLNAACSRCVVLTEKHASSERSHPTARLVG